MTLADRFEKVTAAIATVLHTIADRLTPIERDMADSAASQEAMAGALQGLNDKVDKLTEMAIETSERTERLESMFGNYLEATKTQRLETQRALIKATELLKGVQGLESEVREKLKAVGGER